MRPYNRQESRRIDGPDHWWEYDDWWVDIYDWEYSANWECRTFYDLVYGGDTVVRFDYPPHVAVHFDWPDISF